MQDTPKSAPDAGESGEAAKTKPVSVPVDGQAQEEAGKVREESGGYD